MTGKEEEQIHKKKKKRNRGRGCEIQGKRRNRQEK
jgi:hypothetical protein